MASDFWHDIEDFFENYVAALNANDEDVILSFLATPHGIRMENETVFLETTEQLRTEMDAMLLTYEQQGVEIMHARMMECTELPGDAAAARLSWDLQDADGNSRLTFDTLYTLAAEDGVWAIVAVDASGEMAAREAAGWMPQPL